MISIYCFKNQSLLLFSSKSGEVRKPPKPPLLRHHLGAPGNSGWVWRGESNLEIQHQNSLHDSSVPFWLSPEALFTSTRVRWACFYGLCDVK